MKVSWDNAREGMEYKKIKGVDRLTVQLLLGSCLTDQLSAFRASWYDPTLEILWNTVKHDQRSRYKFSSEDTTDLVNPE